MPLELIARQAVASSDYEDKLRDLPKLTKSAKTKRLETILADRNNAMRRIGQGMIGPIQIRLRYEGIVRNVLIEDTLERGPLMPYHSYSASRASLASARKTCTTSVSTRLSTHRMKPVRRSRSRRTHV
jgi:hypothetical protein